jgi:hypothetical protein
MSKTFTQFRVDNVTTTIPTTLEYGQEVYYKDASGNLTLWVGHEDGTAWPSVGYKEIRCSYSIPAGTGGFANRVFTTIDNNTGEDVEVTDVGNASLVIGLSETELTISNCILTIPPKITYSTGIDFDIDVTFVTNGTITLVNISADYTDAGTPFRYSFTIKIYPS